MRKFIVTLCILAICLLAGCQNQPDTIRLDSLSCEIPPMYTAASGKDIGAEQMFQNQQSYICTYKQSKEQLIKSIRENGVACDFISLESYVRSYTEDNGLDAQLLGDTDTWYLKDTVTMGDTEYTYMCIFYETEENFWRVYGCFPSTQWETDSQDIWESLIAFH